MGFWSVRERVKIGPYKSVPTTQQYIQYCLYSGESDIRNTPPTTRTGLFANSKRVLQYG
jgi:hypothetical protein